MAAFLSCCSNFIFCVLLLCILQCGCQGGLEVDHYHDQNRAAVRRPHHHGSRGIFLRRLTLSRYIIVDQSGSGHFTTIQEAIDNIPINNAQWVCIQINAGVYREKVTIPSYKPKIILQGAGRLSTIITWSAAAGGDHGTADTATFSSFAPNFIARGMGFRNEAPRPPPGASGRQAVAALLAGDMGAFYNCGFYGAQDTLFDYQGRHYFKDCYIEGSIDFIFGHGRSTYKGCDLYVDADTGYLSGSITAQNRADPRENSGFVFIACKIRGTGEVFLGRAWGPYSRVIFAYTYMANIVVPQGWDDWGLAQRHRSVEYGQYRCYGPGSNTKGRVKWSRDLTAAEVQPYLSLAFIDGALWLTEF